MPDKHKDQFNNEDIFNSWNNFSFIFFYLVYNSTVILALVVFVFKFNLEF